MYNNVSPLCAAGAPDLFGEASQRVVWVPETRSCHTIAFVQLSGKLPSPATL